MQAHVTRMIDTLKYAKKLQAAGVSREAAELQAEALTEVLAGAVETVLVTKEDLHQTEHQLNVKIDTAVLATKEDLRQTEHQLNVRIDTAVLGMKEDLRQTEQQLNIKIDSVDKRMNVMELRLTKQIHSMTVKTIGILGALMALFSALTALVHLH